MKSRHDTTLIGWLLVGWCGFLLLPWYAQDDGFFALDWLNAGFLADRDYAPALVQALWHGRIWLLPLVVPLVLPLLALSPGATPRRRADWLILAGVLGLVWLAVQGMAVTHRGPADWLAPLVPERSRQYGVGAGAVLVALSFLFTLTNGLAARGAVKGDRFVAGSIGLVVAVVALFVFLPVGMVLVGALQDSEGAFAPAFFVAQFSDARIWGVACIYSELRCGVAWNSFLLAVLTGLSTTLLGLAFALIATRTAFPFKRSLRVLTVLPIITPPFVIGLAIILLFGRNGTITQFVSDLFGIAPGRWIYGLPGVWFAQTLAFTPIAFLVLIGVVEGVSPSMEEAAQTLRADGWTTFKTVSLPLMRPGLANAFLLGFIESLADFGNPLVLSGNFDVLSTEIFFAMVGAQHDPGRAAVMALVLLGFTLLAFWAQQRWLGRRNYTTVTGKGDGGVPLQLVPPLRWTLYAVTMPWAALTIMLYALILMGGLVEFWGRDYTPTLRHMVAAFGVTTGEHGLVWSGTAWNSFGTTIAIALIASVPTAIIGLLTGWLLVRQDFGMKRSFEFGTMLSFAIPGTVIGIAYILAFNVPPIEITGTGIILVISFVFRNMPVGVRAGIASMSQLDKSLDEASLTLRASSFTTMRRIILPLLRPAILAALVYSFVRAMTAISAVVFLVSAQYEMATTYILGRVENGEYGVAVAYASVLILVMLVVIGIFQLLVGERRLGRRRAGPVAAPVGAAS
ncbi:ABC transporter permease [Geminicoccus roseus]|uniref:ABC transporter permease n=1 Tax=Geminicoccus roseus TaxID=404900 RepID=UPI00041E79D7|nr:iron ABC transporter permease [Geminicoccus roseus]